MYSFLGIIMVTESIVLEGRVSWVGNQIVSTRIFWLHFWIIVQFSYNIGSLFATCALVGSVQLHQGLGSCCDCQKNVSDSGRGSLFRSICRYVTFQVRSRLRRSTVGLRSVVFSPREYVMSGLQVDARAWRAIFSVIVCSDVSSDDVSSTVGLWKCVCSKIVWLLQPGECRMGC